jgi:hypothetical protein
MRFWIRLDSARSEIAVQSGSYELSALENALHALWPVVCSEAGSTENELSCRQELTRLTGVNSAAESAAEYVSIRLLELMRTDEEELTTPLLQEAAAVACCTRSLREACSHFLRSRRYSQPRPNSKLD